MKRTLKYALTMFGLHFGGMVAALFLVPVYGAMWSNNAIFQWAMTLCIIAILAILLWIPSADIGVKDYMHDELLEKNLKSDEPRWFYAAKGLVGGLISQAPALLLLLLAVLMPESGFFKTMVQGWYYMFKKLMDTWPNLWALICLGGGLFSTAVCALGYIQGSEMRLRTKIIIERNDAKIERMKAKKG